MGMFDTLSISDSLPYTQEMKDLGLSSNNHNWQTKDLDNSMSLYYIQGGRLLEQKYKTTEWVEGDSKSKNWLDRIGHMKRENPYLEPVYHHGEIYFYDFVQNVQDKWDCWIEFKATFTNGFVDRYELVKFDKKDNSERLQQEKEWKENQEKIASVWYNRYFFYTKPVRWFMNRVWYRFFTKLSTLCSKVANFRT